MQPSSSSQFNVAITKLEGICEQKLWQYQSDWKSGRLADNDICYWKNFVAKYYAPDSKRRFCMSGLKDQAIMSMQRTKEKWHCSICKEFSDKCRIEYSFNEMAENFRMKFEMGMEESLTLGPGKIANSRSDQIAIFFKNMNLLSKRQSTSRSSTGELLVVFNTELKILQWNCCVRHSKEFCHSEEFISRTSLNPWPLLQFANTKESQGGINESGEDPQFKKSMEMINDSQVRQRFGSMNSPQNSNNFTESQHKWVIPISDMAVCVNSNSCKTLKRSLSNSGLEMDSHPEQQQATQQRMEMNTSNNDSNNTAPSNLEEEEILKQLLHQRFENIMDDILKAESTDELYALIDNILK